MPRSSRISEVPQRQVTRGSHPIRTSSSDSDPLHNRPTTDRSSPKIGDRRSPRGTPLSDSVNQKKLGTRIADLESQLGQAQEELKVLKHQLDSAEAAKNEAQAELEKKTKKRVVAANGKPSPTHSRDSKKTDNSGRDEVPEAFQPETDVFEVSVEKVTLEPKVELEEAKPVEKKTKTIEVPVELTAAPVFEKPSFHDLALKDDEINLLKAKLEEKEKELEASVEKNENLKKQLEDAALSISTSKAKEDETALKLREAEKELEASKLDSTQLKKKLESISGEKEALETEMKKLRVQTEQWKKAADAAAAILSGGVEMNGSVPDRCSSMDKHFRGILQPSAGGYAGYVGSPGLGDDLDDGFGSGKRKSSSKKIFGELWKRKGQK